MNIVYRSHVRVVLILRTPPVEGWMEVQRVCIHFQSEVAVFGQDRSDVIGSTVPVTTGAFLPMCTFEATFTLFIPNHFFNEVLKGGEVSPP